MNSVKWPCSPWVLVAQWIERPPGVREVMGSIPVGDSEFFFVPRSCHVDLFTFTWLCLVVPVRTIRQMWIAWQSATVANTSISDVLRSEWRWRRGPRGEEDTHIRRTGVLLKNFDPLRSPKRYQDPVFSPLKDTNSYITHLPASYLFGSMP